MCLLVKLYNMTYHRSHRIAAWLESGTYEMVLHKEADRGSCCAGVVLLTNASDELSLAEVGNLSPYTWTLQLCRGRALNIVLFRMTLSLRLH